jgi:hypothetical protein
MLRVIRPETGEEPAGFFDLLRVIRPEGRLTAPFSPSRSATSPNPKQEKTAGLRRTVPFSRTQRVFDVLNLTERMVSEEKNQKGFFDLFHHGEMKRNISGKYIFRLFAKGWRIQQSEKNSLS